MLQNIIIVMITLSVIGLPTLAQAETGSSTPSTLKPLAEIRASIKHRAEVAREKFKNSRDEVRTDRMEDRDLFKTERKDIRNEHKDGIIEIKKDDSLSTSSKKEAFASEKGIFAGKLDDLRSDRLEAYADRVERRLSAAIERIESLIERLEDRLSLLETKNKNFDADDSRDMLGKAKVSLGEAKVALADFEAKMGELVSTSTPKEAFGSVRTAAGTVIEKVTSAHQNVLAVIKAIKADKGVSETEAKSN